MAHCSYDGSLRSTVAPFFSGNCRTMSGMSSRKAFMISACSPGSAMASLLVIAIRKT